jgi:Sec-independent protein translocase protein TatA
VIAIIGNLAIPELLIIAVGAVIVFGRRLPEVSMRGAAQLLKLRRTVTDMWREAGLEEELRRVRREIDQKVRAIDVPRLPRPQEMARDFFEAAPEKPAGADVAGEAPFEHDSPAGDDSFGPSEEERRAEAGKDVAGHGPETPGTPDKDREAS